MSADGETLVTLAKLGPADRARILAELDALPVRRVALQPDDGVYIAAELRVMLRVSRRSVERWATEGRVPVSRTPGGRLRFPAGPVNALLRGGPC